MLLQIADFKIHKSLIRTRVGGLYHPILHLHPDDMNALNIICGGSILVRGTTSLKNTSQNNSTNNTDIIAIAWPQVGAQVGQARLSRLLRRCLTQGQTSLDEGVLKYVHVRATTNESNERILRLVDCLRCYRCCLAFHQRHHRHHHLSYVYHLRPLHLQREELRG